MSDGLTVPFALAAGLSGAVESTSIVITAGLAEITRGGPVHLDLQKALEIESVDGTTTILRFRVAALPETVDGIVRRCALPSC